MGNAPINNKITTIRRISPITPSTSKVGALFKASLKPGGKAHGVSYSIEFFTVIRYPESVNIRSLLPLSLGLLAALLTQPLLGDTVYSINGNGTVSAYQTGGHVISNNFITVVTGAWLTVTQRLYSGSYFWPVR